ncbi:shikimate dehydrogenase [Thermovorax subterraneus]|nr:shikimate dehydrogenase [Thermovorax subterraneus]
MQGKGLPELAVIGWPLKKTFSPIIQNAALKSSGIKWKYEAIPVPPDEVDKFFLKASKEMRGFNVTMPHKPRAYELCDERDNFADVCGAVNTVVFRQIEGKIKIFGYNTDGPGLMRALSERTKKTISSALFLGAGGAAAGGIAALLACGTGQIYIANRTLGKAEDLAESFRRNFKASKIAAIELKREHILEVLKEVELVVNCIPDEGAASLEDVLTEDGKGKIFCDFSYGEKPGKLYLRAEKLGYTMISGVEILVWQGAYAFEIFTGVECPVESMKNALKEEIGSWWLGC